MKGSVLRSIVLITFISIAFVMFTSKEKAEVEENYYYKIPEEAVRLRILANSNSVEDQALKHQVRDQVNAHIHHLVKEIDDIELARRVIAEEVPALEKVIAKTLKEAGVPYTFSVVYDQAVPFPEKTYGPYVYPAGDYEAVLVTLGEGQGENWWCVLFPPLCFIDFFGETKLAEHTEEEMLEEEEGSNGETEIRFFFLDLFKL